MSAGNDEFLTPAKSFAKMLYSKLSQVSALTLEAASFRDEGAQVVASADKYYGLISDELDGLPVKRVDKLTSERNRLLILIGAVLAVALLFFLAFYRSVHQAVSELEKMAGQMAGGDFRGRIRLDTKDELSRVGDAFNRMAESFCNLLFKNKVLSEQVAASAEELNAIANQSTSCNIKAGARFRRRPFWFIGV